MAQSGLLLGRKKATFNVKRNNIIFSPETSPFRKRLSVHSMSGKMDKIVEVVNSSFHELYQDVEVIKDTLLLLGKQNESTANQLSEILTKLDPPLIHVNARLPLPFLPIPAGRAQADMDNVSTVSSNDTEDGIIRKTGFQTTCMASAIQSWFCDIIKNMLFSAVNDEALEKGIVTHDEHEKFRKMTDEENAKRLLICSVMDKSYDTMSVFVNIIGRHSKDLRDSIMSTFQGQTKTTMVRNALNKECARCLIERRCDLVSLCDFYFTHKLINRDFFNDVIRSAPQTRSKQWSHLFATVASTGEDTYALSLMRNYLSENDQFDFHSDIVKQIDRDLRNGKRSLKCRCRPSRGQLTSVSLPQTTRDVRHSQRTRDVIKPPTTIGVWRHPRRTRYVSYPETTRDASNPQRTRYVSNPVAKLLNDQ